MSVCIRLTLVSCLSLLLGPSAIGSRATAAEPKPAAEAAPPTTPEAPPGPKNQEFRKLFSQWEAMLAEIRQLRAEYPTADADRKQQIKTQFDELVKQGGAMQPRLVDSAREAYAEAPNATEAAGMVLADVVERECRRENYEAVLAPAGALIEGGYPEKSIYAWAGLAALVTCRLDAAQEYLDAAAKHNAFGVLNKLPRDHQLRQLDQIYRELIPYYRKAWPEEQAIRAAEAKADDLPRVLLVTNQGEIELELFENEAPNTVANFISLVEKGFYDGLTFHRVIPGFMAQGGSSDGTGGGGPGYTIPDECHRPEHRLHFRGSLSMAKTPAPDSGGSQFFLNFAPTKHLDGKHTVFGRVVRGLEVLAKLRRRDPQAPNPPTPDKILEAKVLRKRDHEYVPKKTGE